MSMEERRQSLLADTADVAEEDKIYLERLAGGGNMSVYEKNSTDAKSSGDLSHSFPDYRGLPSDEQSLAGAALQSVKFSFKISRQRLKEN